MAAELASHLRADGHIVEHGDRDRGVTVHQCNLGSLLCYDLDHAKREVAVMSRRPWFAGVWRGLSSDWRGRQSARSCNAESVRSTVCR